MNRDVESKNIEVKPLPEEKALDKGIEVFYELLLYSILIIIPIYEYKRNQVKKA